MGETSLCNLQKNKMKNKKKGVPLPANQKKTTKKIKNNNNNN